VFSEGNWHDDNGTSGYHFDNGLFSMAFFDTDGRFLITQHSTYVVENNGFRAVALPEGPVVVYDGHIDLDDYGYVEKLMNNLSIVIYPEGG